MTCFNFNYFFSPFSAFSCMLLLLSYLASPASLESVDASSIASDLKAGTRQVVAVGSIASQLTLIISRGTASSAWTPDFFQVAVGEANGVIQLSGGRPLVGVPSGQIPTDAGVKLIALDATGAAFLVAMSSSSVGILQLSTSSSSSAGSYQPASISAGLGIKLCYSGGLLHLASSQARRYYTLNQTDGALRLYHFEGGGGSIAASSWCAGGQRLGYLCAGSGAIFGSISLASGDCDGTGGSGRAPLSGLISGYVGTDKVFLFGGSNTVFSFPSSVIAERSGVPARLTVVGRKDAWKGPEEQLPLMPPPPPQPEAPEGEASDGLSPAMLSALIGGPLLLLVTAAFGTLVYCCCFCKEDGGRSQNQNKNKAGAGAGRGRRGGLKKATPQKRGYISPASSGSVPGGSPYSVATPQSPYGGKGTASQASSAFSRRYF